MISKKERGNKVFFSVNIIREKIKFCSKIKKIFYREIWQKIKPLKYAKKNRSKFY